MIIACNDSVCVSVCVRTKRREERRRNQNGERARGFDVHAAGEVEINERCVGRVLSVCVCVCMGRRGRGRG